MEVEAANEINRPLAADLSLRVHLNHWAFISTLTGVQ